MIGPSHLSHGQEATAVGVAAALEEDDQMISNYRGHGHAIARDVPMNMLMAELFGRADGTCRGLGGSMHSAMYPEKNIVYATAIVGAGIPIAAGAGLAFKLRGEKKVAVVFFGDGATNIGGFHEGINLAAVWRLPVIFVCENNLYAMSTKAENALAGGSVAKRAVAYGIPGVTVDGNDVLQVYDATAKARMRALEGDGPSLLECRTYKFSGHGVYDKGEYRPKEEYESWRSLDPITKMKKTMVERRVAGEAELEALDREVQAEVEAAVEFSKKSPILKFEELKDLVYA